MALKSFDEMLKLDISSFCDTRKGKDDRGKEIDLAYLNWAECVRLLHENGANVVYFQPLVNEKGSSLFCTERVFGDPKDGKTNQCYEVGVHIVIDDLEFDMRGPLMNGSNPVRDNSISQQRVWNCQARLFVKGVAIRTGLGFSLWLDEEKNDEKYNSADDLSFHDARKIKERIEKLVTIKLDNGLTVDEIGEKTNVGSADDVRELLRQCNKLFNFELALRQL